MPFDNPLIFKPAEHAERTCVFTIVSRNYFHYALNLMASVAVHLPGCQRVVVICDQLDGLDVGTSGIELLGIEALGIEAIDRMVVHYTILELNTAIKPFAFSKLFERANAQHVVYFDPDIQLYSTGAPLLNVLQQADVVLTPHLLAPLDDDRHPSDLAILQSGTYNLGFLALTQSANSQRLLTWWQQKLVRECVVDIPRGLFTDQKWMDLVPGLFERVHIERDAGWNVAYWNLKHRLVQHTTAGYSVNGGALFFFHFSGYDPRFAAISKHQDRYQLNDCSAATQALFADYTQNLLSAGRERFAALPYAFACLADGTPLPECARQLIRKELDWTEALPDLRSLAGARYLVDFLTAPVDGQRPMVSKLALQLYESRDDLRAAFPDVLGGHRQAFVDWFAQAAGPEAGIFGALAGVATAAQPKPAAPPVETARATQPLPPQGVPAAAAHLQPAGQAPVLAAPPLTYSLNVAPARAVWPFRLAYRLAWKARHVLRPMTTLAFRQQARSSLIRLAFPATARAPDAAAAALAPQAAVQSVQPAGVTVIGYVQAESGVGESARATLRALAATQVPHSLFDFRVGNVSRMGEAVDTRLASGRQHAVSLFHVNADQLPLARTFLGEAPFSVAHRIGFWAWELENFPPEWHGAFGHVDEVWVPSSFCQRAIAACSPVPVLVFPHAIEIPDQLVPDRARFGLRASSVAFLAMADMMSIAERKNPFGAVEAFAAAFGDGAADVELVVKISNPERDDAAFRRLQALAASCPGIHLRVDPLDRPTLNSLIDSVDCFVSLHRSEGFGLVIAEAMARGKVVVATGWSGNMDFMTAHNSLPVDYVLATLGSDSGPYKQGERWAIASPVDAVAKLHLVALDAALRLRLGARARADCQRQLAPGVVGAGMAARLQTIFSAKRLGPV